MIISSAAAFVLTAVMGEDGLVVVGTAAAPAAAAVAAGVPGRGPGGVGIGIVDGRTTFVWAGRSVVGPPARFVAAVVVVVVVTAPVAVAAAGFVAAAAMLVAAAARFVAAWVRLVAAAVRFVTRGTGAAVVGGVRNGTSGVGTGATLVDSDRIGRCGTGTVPRLVLVACPKALIMRARVVSNVKVFIFRFSKITCAVWYPPSGECWSWAARLFWVPWVGLPVGLLLSVARRFWSPVFWQSSPRAASSPG